MNPRELEILIILMKSKESLTSSQIANIRDELSQSTVQTVLRKLLKAGLVEVTGVTHSGNVLSRQWKQSAIAEEKILEHVAKEVGELKDIIPREKMMKAIYGK